jgi:hypothetical protein
MSLVAVVTRPGDRPGELPETRVVPVGMAQNTDFAAYFGSRGSAMPAAGGPGISYSRITESVKLPMDSYISPNSYMAKPVGPPLYRRSMPPAGPRWCRSDGKARQGETNEDILLDLASRIAPDGGMPGKDRESRAIATVIALLAFLSLGHTPRGGTFRSHAARLVSFLKLMGGLSSHHHDTVTAVIDLARKGTAPAGDWLTLARASGDHWKEVESSVVSA